MAAPGRRMLQEAREKLGWGGGRLSVFGFRPSLLDASPSGVSDLLRRMRCDVGIACRGLALPVAKQVTDHGQRAADINTDRRERVPQIVQADIIEASGGA